MLALVIKKTITLFALVGPVSMIPVFLAATEHLDDVKRKIFARSIGASVTAALLVAAFLGVKLLDLLGVSLASMQVGGGIIVLLLAIAMVLGKESNFKGSSDTAAPQASIVPLGIPLLAGPAAFSYVMSNSSWHDYIDILPVVTPIFVVGLFCWGIFHFSVQANERIETSSLGVVERIAGFLLAALAIEMIATGIKGLFPVLTA